MNATPRSRLLMIELVCDMVIFVLCAVVCIALLVQARTMGLQSNHLTQAVYIAQTAAETWKAGAAVDPNPQGDYQVECRPSEQAPFTKTSASVETCDIVVTLDGAVIYTLEGVAAP